MSLSRNLRGASHEASKERGLLVLQGGKMERGTKEFDKQFTTGQNFQTKNEER